MRFENQDYMILRFSTDSNRGGYQIARYEIQDDNLTVWVLDVEKVRDAFKRTGVRGSLAGNTTQGLVVSNSAITVLKLPKSNDLFVLLGEFERTVAK